MNSIFFVPPPKYFEWQKSFEKIKIFVENFLYSKPAKLYLRGVNKLSDEWQEMIPDNDEYSIEIILLLNYL